jgi:hypothetical protein
MRIYYGNANIGACACRINAQTLSLHFAESSIHIMGPFTDFPGVFTCLPTGLLCVGSTANGFGGTILSMKAPGMRNKGSGVGREAAEGLAVAALSFLAGEPERLGQFLAATGIGPENVREAAREANFLLGVLDHLAGDEALLIAFAAEAGIDPAEVGRARAALGGVWEGDLP